MQDPGSLESLDPYQISVAFIETFRLLTLQTLTSVLRVFSENVAPAHSATCCEHRICRFLVAPGGLAQRRKPQGREVQLEAELLAEREAKRLLEDKVCHTVAL